METRSQPGWTQPEGNVGQGRLMVSYRFMRPPNSWQRHFTTFSDIFRHFPTNFRHLPTRHWQFPTRYRQFPTLHPQFLTRYRDFTTSQLTLTFYDIFRQFTKFLWHFTTIFDEILRQFSTKFYDNFRRNFTTFYDKIYVVKCRCQLLGGDLLWGPPAPNLVYFPNGGKWMGNGGIRSPLLNVPMKFLNKKWLNP